MKGWPIQNMIMASKAQLVLQKPINPLIYEKELLKFSSYKQPNNSQTVKMRFMNQTTLRPKFLEDVWSI